MTLLSTNYSNALLTLFENGRPPLSLVELGPWFSVSQVAEAQRKLPQCEIHFHASNLLTESLSAAQAIQQIQAYHAAARSPWVSAHIDLLPPGYYQLIRRLHIHLPVPAKQMLTRRYISRVRRLKAAMDIPVILENMPSLNHKRYYYQSDPQRIKAILEQTGCDMLLDIGHARVAASVSETDIYEYLGQFPLEKVVHMHISGPREKDGSLVDAHEPLQEEDYEILQWLLAQKRPQILTLEYFRDATALLDQLKRLAAIIAA
ncbi:MAG: DUF692 family protein [Candidatus Promineifilaceae bacterium]|nr:DUF692 family protein [Candidatus Promineifilaceae bacterium]